MLFKLMPALLKCDLVPIVPNAILDGHLPIILGSVLDSILDLVFGVPPFADLPVYGRFLDLGCWSGPVFGPLLDRTLDRVFGRLEIRLCSLSHKNSLDVCLPIANKTAHPVRVRLVGK
jgi:hypothetical protein